MAGEVEKGNISVSRRVGFSDPKVDGSRAWLVGERKNIVLAYRGDGTRAGCLRIKGIPRQGSGQKVEGGQKTFQSRC